MSAPKYKKLSQHQHILELPDTYIGSTKTNQETRWVYDETSHKMVWRSLMFNPGLYKIVDEIVVNARDELVRSMTTAGKTPVKHIDVTVHHQEGGDTVISVQNDGDGIPIEMNEEEKMMIPEMIFGNLLTSSNYDSSEEKIVGGKNGVGQKCISPNTPVLLWSAPPKRADEIVVGDELIGDDGTRRCVLEVVRGEGALYEVMQTNGESYTVNEEHILTLCLPEHKLIFWNAAKKGWGVRWWNHAESRLCMTMEVGVNGAALLCPESAESLMARMRLESFCKTISNNGVFDMSIKDYMALNSATKMQLAGVRGACVQWPHKSVPLDPYVLGLWMGERSFIHHASFTNPLIMESLLHYDVMEHKHIPNDYLFNDRATRLAVLAGIIDTDGSVVRNRTRIRIVKHKRYERLAHQIVFLVRSLGFHCEQEIHDTTWMHKGVKKHNLTYGIYVTGEGIQDIPTRLVHKQCVSPPPRSSHMGRVAVVDKGYGPYVGIRIDGNERFLINDFTVTHNCSNIMSKLFTIDIKSPASGKQYTQSWYDNMFRVEKPLIKKCSSKTGHVSITFIPDRKRFVGAFDEKGITADMVSCFHTRIIELAALVGKEVKVTWNGTLVASNTFEKYIKLFLRDGMTGFAYEDCGPRWEVGAILARHLYSEEEELPEDKHVSFVNGIHTKKGGKHVETVGRKVLADFCELAKKKKIDIKPGQLKNAVVLFINATIVNPSFDSQSKEYLSTPAAEFGSKPEYSGKLVEQLGKLGLFEEAKFLLEAKSLRETKKTDGKKRSVLRGMTKLEDAMLAGTAKSRECTLILTEGDSAATSAISGLKEVGRERWGVFPLRGKLLNVRDITIQKFNANEELTAIKKILGLEQGKKYKDGSELRYGRVMVMADQDHDGSHIKGLLMNLFHTEWPGLMQTGFLCTLLTPILKATKGSNTVSFYSIPEFQQWKQAQPAGLPGWKIKYYKGLGTSTPTEAREWFKNLHEIQYEWDEKTDESMNLAFNKKLADDRKRWLSHYEPSKMLVPVGGRASYTSFVNDELIHFSNADNIRSLPHLMDGLKPSQRKILFACLKRNLREEIRVAQLAGYVSEHAAYHHGEASLNGTIIGMAQNFVGSNNINLLKPVGQFGSRLHGGQDAASPRYIHTYLESIVSTLFRKEDMNLLTYIDDDGDLVEPEYYLPVVPFLAINGSIGIGTGYSTNLPPHKPDDIVCLLRHRLEGSMATLEGHALDPWWFGFKGVTQRVDEFTWMTRGIYALDDEKHTVTVTELPVGTWTKDYKAFLDARLDIEEKVSKEAKKEAKKAETSSNRSSKEDAEPCGLKGFDDLYNDVDVHFILYFTEEGYDAIKDNVESFEKSFKLITTWKTTNMTCFDTEFNIVKYKTVGDLMEAFVRKRLPMYEARRQSMLETLGAQMRELDAKRRFIQALLEGTLVLQKKSDEEIVAQLQAIPIPPSNPSQPDVYDSYDYVLRMRMDRVKQSAVTELEKQLEEKQKEVEQLEGETGASLWLADLEAFRLAWVQYTENRRAESVPMALAEKSKKKPSLRK